MSNKKKASPHVPDQFRGFTAQQTRMAYLLLTSPEGHCVSLEKLDDVAVESAAGDVRAVQVKDTEATNPVSNRSPQLWKTFANWVRDIQERRLSPSQTHFEIYVNRKVTGTLVEAFNKASTKKLANEAFEKARNLLWGEIPNYDKKKKVAEALEEHLHVIFSPAGEKCFKQIIERFHFECSKITPEADLQKVLQDTMKFEELAIVQEVLASVHGWLKIAIDEQLRLRKPPTIAVDDFLVRIRASYQKLKPGGALPDLSGERPNLKDITSMMDQRFVKQMDIIELDKISSQRSITCFLKARTTRTKWAQNGDALLLDDDITEFEDGLRQQWRNIRLEIDSDPLRTDEILRGKLVLAKCESHNRTVEGKTVPEYFISGCFHELANRTDDIGWHPNFKTLLDEEAA